MDAGHPVRFCTIKGFARGDAECAAIKFVCANSAAPRDPLAKELQTSPGWPASIRCRYGPGHDEFCKVLNQLEKLGEETILPPTALTPPRPLTTVGAWWGNGR